MCRRTSRHFAAFTATRPGALVLIESEGLRWYRSSTSARRGFCGTCGSSLFWEPTSGDRVSPYDEEYGLRLDVGAVMAFSLDAVEARNHFIHARGLMPIGGNATLQCLEYVDAMVDVPEARIRAEHATLRGL
jgi:hypothetical protein